MEWLFFQSQAHRHAQVRREVFVVPSPHPEIQLWGLTLPTVPNTDSSIPGFAVIFHNKNYSY